MRTYGWSYNHVRFGMTGAQGWVWYNLAMESEMTAFGPLHKRSSDGYVRQETRRLVKVAKDTWARSKKSNK